MSTFTGLPAYLAEVQREIEGYARSYGLNFFATVFEILDYKRMNEVAAYGGFPVRYPHWRFGMEYEHLSKGYEYGLAKIYEMVINNNPCYAYLLEGNSIVDQKMVMAHVLAHCDFFRNNYYFSKTNRKMIDGMGNHAARIRKHAERQGIEKVEDFLDTCFSIDDLIDQHAPYIKRHALHDEASDQADALAALETPKFRAKPYMDKFINPPELMAAEHQRIEKEKEKSKKIPAELERDVLSFLLEHAPLENWERDILETVREEAYYFAPQGMTKIMNEGWATYWHSRIMTEKVLKSSEIIDYADHASGVTASAPGQLNPYRLGVELFRDIEDRWNRGLFGKEWEECADQEKRRHWDQHLGLGRKKIFEVRQHYNDITFIDEFFTENFCRENKFFTFGFNERSSNWEIESREFSKVKDKLLSRLTNLGRPFIYVEDGNFENRGELLLRHRHEGVDLQMNHARDTLAALSRVWKRPVNLLTRVDGQGRLLRCDDKDYSDKSATY